MKIIDLLVTLCCALTALSAPLHLLAGTHVPNQYIILFHENVLESTVREHLNWLSSHLPSVRPNLRVQGEFETNGFVDDVFGVVHEYFLPGFKGYSARLPAFLVDIIRALHIVAHVEEDKILTIFGTQKNTPSWGLVRISNRDLPKPNDKTYTYPDSAGSITVFILAGVFAYVIDTGIHVAHPELQGRAIIGKSFTKDGTKDGNGHGTHVAGTIGSKTFGVAKNVTLVAVKVLDANGAGTTSDVIAGIEWASKNATGRARESKEKKLKYVANMSLGGGASTALDRAVKAAIANGLVFAVAAGNSARDACLLSPARVPEAITVGASDKEDNFASFSEGGKCVDIIAPGVDITSIWNNGKTNTISGTSMATPHVVGVVALALAEGSFTKASEVHEYMKTVSSKDRVFGTLRGAPNSLLYNNVKGGEIPDDEPVEPQPTPDEPETPPNEGECPIPQCFFDQACTSCCVDCLA